MRAVRRAAWLLSLVVVAACAPRARAPAASVRWDAMSKEDKLAYMTTTVTPRMKSAFMAFDPHRYPKLDCTTCHGPGGAERGWAMPNPDLLLEPSPWTTAGADAARAPSHMDAFMSGIVAKEMGSLVGRPFGCFGCHTPER